jgi:hypothetical protein
MPTTSRRVLKQTSSAIVAAGLRQSRAESSWQFSV